MNTTAGSLAPANTEAAGPKDSHLATDRRTALLQDPVLPQLARLALPILVVLMVQALVGVAETYFVSSLGTSALAGVALVFPVVMLMTMMSNGGIGGGVSSAIARALGGGRQQEANALVLHTLVIAVGFGALFTAGFVFGGPALYTALGGSGDVLSNALRYSDLVFGGSILIWVTNLLAAALRGAGNVKVPAVMTAAGAAVTLALSPLLIFGWGPVPAYGVAGAGMAMVVYYAVAAAALLAYMRSARSPVRLTAVRVQWPLFREILRVGLLAAVGTLTANVTVLAAAGLVGGFGASAIAGYGAASRLDYLLIPLLFAIGTASVTMVGMNIGAGLVERARRIAWVSAGFSAAVCGVIGLTAALLPGYWNSIFSAQPEVTAVGDLYLRWVAPCYGLYGAGMALYFASQGAGRVAWPLIASVARLGLVLAAGSYWVSLAQGDLAGLFGILAVSYVLFAAVNLVAFGSGISWKRALTPPKATN
jgi:putative MATE family efflux protein